MTPKKQALLTVLLLGTLVAILNITFYGFRNSDDGPFWIAAAKYFLSGGTYLDHVTIHYLFNPLLPVITGLITLLGLTFWQAYPIVNLTAYFVSLYLLFELTVKLTGKIRVAFLTATLFAIDYQTQLLAFSIMPDVVTWTAILLILNLVTNLWQSSGPSTIKSAFVWGVVIGLATLLKTNLAFLFPLYPAIIFFKKEG